MSEPILENAEPKVEKRKRKPLSEEDKKRQLENLRLGRELSLIHISEPTRPY